MATTPSLENARRINRMQRQTLRAEDVASSTENFCIESHRGIELIPVASVSHIVADQKYVTLYHAGGEALMDRLSPIAGSLRLPASIGFVPEDRLRDARLRLQRGRVQALPVDRAAPQALVRRA